MYIHLSLKFPSSYSKVSSAAKQRVLGAVGALVKRAAAAHAEQVATAWRSTFTSNSSGDSRRVAVNRPRILTHPPDDSGPPCPLMVRLIDHIETLIQAALNDVEEVYALITEQSLRKNWVFRTLTLLNVYAVSFSSAYRFDRHLNKFHTASVWGDDHLYPPLSKTNKCRATKQFSV